MMNWKKVLVKISAFCWMPLISPVLSADMVELNDGSVLKGEIIKVFEGKLAIETSFAGVLEFKLSEVKSFSSEDTETVRLKSGDVLVGPVRETETGKIAVETSGGTVETSAKDVEAVWAPGDADPEVVARRKELEDSIRKWSVQTAVSLTGKSGNTDKSSYAISADAKLEGPNDRLDLYVDYNYGEENGTRSADEAILGMAYTSFFSKKYGWYFREELEYDTFENIDFRSTTGAGISYRVFKRPTHSLETRAGLSYRYDSYGDNGAIPAYTEDFPGLDFGLKHYWKFAEWGEVTNSLTYTPSIDDFGDYLVDHSSAMDIPLAASNFWKFRLSLSNQYNSAPAAGRDELDTTYALSLLMNWR